MLLRNGAVGLLKGNRGRLLSDGTGRKSFGSGTTRFDVIGLLLATTASTVYLLRETMKMEEYLKQQKLEKKPREVEESNVKETN